MQYTDKQKQIINTRTIMIKQKIIIPYVFTWKQFEWLTMSQKLPVKTLNGKNTFKFNETSQKTMMNIVKKDIYLK